VDFRQFLRQLFKAVLSLLTTRPWSLSGVESGVKDIKNLFLSWGGMLSRQFGLRAILLVGIFYSGYSVYLYVNHKIAPDAPSASHDAILKSRWSSPKPDERIVIVDVDERSLAMLAPEYGRWPWPRSVLAEGMQKIADAGSKAILFNVLLSDPDKYNPDADAVMEVVSAMVQGAAFPLIRLNPDNDTKSKLTVGELLARTKDNAVNSEKTVAVILPMFEAMLDRVGVANQSPDRDGAIRRYPVLWKDNVLVMPSIATRTVALAGFSDNNLPEKITLNWRNKRGAYQRISFSDLLALSQDDPKLTRLKGSIVVLGVSAPGLGQTKGTAVKSVEDDNEILATALDDILNKTYLRTLPAWFVLVVEFASIWALVWLACGNTLSPMLTKAFIGVQSGAASITMLSASYTNYLVDLTGCMGFGFGVYAAIKMVQSLDNGWSRAKPGLRRAASPQGRGIILVLGYLDSDVVRVQAQELQKLLEKRLGLEAVFRVDDLFAGDNPIRPICQDFSCQICFVPEDRLFGILAELRDLSFYEKLDLRETTLTSEWHPENEDFRAELTPYLLRQCADLLEAGSALSPGLPA